MGQTTVVFDGMPQFTERPPKARQTRPRIFGNTIFADEMLRALLRYGGGDRYWLYARELNYDFHQDERRLPSRVSIVTPATAYMLATVSNPVLVTPRAFPQNMTPLRSQLRLDAPTVSFVHALSDITSVELAVHLLSRGFESEDTVVCSSSAARIAIQNLLEWTATEMGLPSSMAEARFQQLPVIPLGVFTDDFSGAKKSARSRLGLKDDERVLLAFGRLTPLAKADLGPLIAALREICCISQKKVRLLIAGDDSRHESMSICLSEYAALLGCQDNLLVYTNVSREMKLDLYAASDIFIAPSDHLQETFGIALVEAMAASMPVVAADWSGFRDIVDDGVDGYLIPTAWPAFSGQMEMVSGPVGMEFRNSLLASATVLDVQCLISRLLDLVEHRETCESMGERARVKATGRYDWNCIVSQYEEMFIELNERTVARAKGRVKGFGPFCYDAQHIFGHYPSRCIEQETLVGATAQGERWLLERFPLSTLPEIKIDAEKVAQILVFVKKRSNEVSVEEILHCVNDKQQTLPFLWLIGRMFKYGLIAPPQLSESDTHSASEAAD